MSDFCFTFTVAHGEEGPDETHDLGTKLVRAMNQRLWNTHACPASYAEICDEHGTSIDFQIIIEQDDVADRDEAENIAQEVAAGACGWVENFREYRER